MERLRGRLSKSRSVFGTSLLGLLGAGDLDEDSWQDVEDTLLMADLGAATTTQIVERLRDELSRRAIRSSAEAREVLHEVLTAQLSTDGERAVRALPHTVDGKKQPAVVLVAGVNGTGKTTTTGKLAWHLSRELGKTTVMAAADTFRAAAVEQLGLWAERAGARFVRGPEGADPGSVAYEGVSTAVRDGADVVIVDTAGRLHTQDNLMEELAKIRRVIAKQIPEAPHETLLTVDATTGQNGLRQAQLFSQAIDVNGLVLTKLDGTAKGGIALAIAHELKIPVKLIGIGEKLEDLRPFAADEFARALVS
jgi:fused signal recognition particle receptor